MITLYVKTHNITGLKYFGKTTASNPHKYRGSGKYWKRHIARHGYDVTTEIVGVFERIEECTRTALQFSLQNDIVRSQLWANLKDENGKDGGFECINDSSDNHKIRCSEAGIKCHVDHPNLAAANFSNKDNESAKLAAKTKLERYGALYFSEIAKYEKTQEHKMKLSVRSKQNGAGKGNLGKVREKVQCPHCEMKGAKNVMLRFHFENCKQIGR